jgi:hypothetical protein
VICLRGHRSASSFAGLGSLGVTLPITLAANCLACHGSPDTIDPVVKAALAAKYLKDQATGFKEGDIRGWIWGEVPPMTSR